MDQEQQSRWRPTRGQLLWAGGIAALVFLVIVICGYLFGWKWTGLPRQTLWDWLSLLIVPAVLALGGYLFTRSENRRIREGADQQRRLDRQIAHVRQQDDLLQAYLEGMSQLQTDEKRPLHRALRGDILSTVARARTLTTLSRLGPVRKRSVVLFLYDSGLITKDHVVLELAGANLQGANLTNANLSGADLSGANLQKAHLSYADLSGANLIHADLDFTDLTDANLSQANLSQARLGKAVLGGKVDLSGANLQRAYLHYANLSGADLSDANLSDAMLWEADLSGANLLGVNLRTAQLKGTDLSDARGISSEQLKELFPSWSGRYKVGRASTLARMGDTIMPNGQKYEDWLKDKEAKGENVENNGPS